MVLGLRWGNSGHMNTVLLSAYRPPAEVHGAAAKLSLSEVDLEQIDRIVVGSVAASGQYSEDPAHRAELEAP